MSDELFELWRPFVPPSLRKGLFSRRAEKEHVPLDRQKDIDAWVKRHFRRFRLEGPKKVLPSWVYDRLVKLYGKAIEHGAIRDLGAELDDRIRKFIEDVVRVGMKDHTFSLQWNADDQKIVLIADCAKGQARALHNDFRQLEETLRLHGFHGIFSKHTAPKDEKMYFILDLTQLCVDVRSVAVWLLLHEYRKSPIIWNDDVWVPQEVPNDADAPIKHLL